MPASVVLPEALLTRFRGVAFERLERIDSTWAALTKGNATPKVEEDLFRELRTLKGDARVVGFPDAAELCQRLENLVAAAKQRRYRVDDDVDIVVTMAIQFLGMLLHKRGEAGGGIDFNGFLDQFEQVLSEWLARPADDPKHPKPTAAQRSQFWADASQRGLGAARGQLAIAATTVYLEHLRASGRSRERLRGVWDVLSRNLTELAASPIGPLLARHATAGREVARQLGKSVEVSADADDVYVTEAVFDALNTIILHLLRNAIDHGVEDAATRARGGKPSSAAIRMQARQREGRIELEISDDGAGIDSVTGVSGRGIGLDAVRAEVARFGGEAHIESRQGVGTTIKLTVPNRQATVDLLLFRAAGAGTTLAVEATWMIEHRSTGDLLVRNPLDLLEIPRRAQVCPEHILHLQRGSKHCAFWTDGASRRAVAIRMCPTPDEAPMEILKIADDGEEVVLLRPEALHPQGVSDE
jgi:two-component system chemotaxis sensor kinase CheA